MESASVQYRVEQGSASPARPAAPPPPARVSARAQKCAAERKALGLTGAAAPAPPPLSSRHLEPQTTQPPMEPPVTEDEKDDSAPTVALQTSRPVQEAPPPVQQTSRPPLAPADSRPAPPIKPTTVPENAYGRQSSVGSEFSSFGGSEGSLEGYVPPTGGAPAMDLTEHERTLPGTEWRAVLDLSREELERSLLKDAAEAVGLDSSFMRLTDVHCTDDGALHVFFAIAHENSLTVETINRQLGSATFPLTKLLHRLRAGDEEEAPVAAEQTTVSPNKIIHSAKDKDSDEDTSEEEKESESDDEEVVGSEDDDDRPEEEDESEDWDDVPVPFHSFVKRVGEGFLLIDYTVSNGGDPEPLELFFDGTPQSLKVNQLLLCVSEYKGVSVEQLSVRTAEDGSVAAHTRGADLGWQNGSQVTVWYEGQEEAPVATAEVKKTEKKKAKKATKKKEKKTAAPKKTKKKTAKKPKKAKKKKSQREEPAVYQGTTSANALKDRPIPEELTTPRCYTPRTPRAGARYEGEYEGKSPYASPVRRSITAAAVEDLSPPRSSVVSGATSRRARRYREVEEVPVPPQQVIKGITPTTPRPAHHRAMGYVVANPELTLSATNRSEYSVSRTRECNKETPSVSRRSHSPLRHHALNNNNNNAEKAGMNHNHNNYNGIPNFSSNVSEGSGNGYLGDDRMEEEDDPMPEEAPNPFV
ncbi:hypothetical protein AGDE_15041 [Angomonas deanei]|nr:hypothetical protein AGDE_15041 [Angomonas deanei]|eukprot:EPY19821.1 hypothetical protein AGDE_15041 [Angomonas deanei]